MDDRQAIDRYRYLLRTAPPEDIERAHEEAFEQLKPEQRQVVLRELSSRVPASEVTGDDPASLARMATRAEMREPGTMERTFANVPGPGLGSIFLATLAGAFVGTAIADAFIGDEPSAESDVSNTDADVASEDAGGDFGGDFGGGDFGGF
jgi:hypothetical protein